MNAVNFPEKKNCFWSVQYIWWVETNNEDGMFYTSPTRLGERAAEQREIKGRKQKQARKSKLNQINIKSRLNSSILYLSIWFFFRIHGQNNFTTIDCISPHNSSCPNFHTQTSAAHVSSQEWSYLWLILLGFVTTYALILCRINTTVMYLCISFPCLCVNFTKYWKNIEKYFFSKFSQHPFLLVLIRVMNT